MDEIFDSTTLLRLNDLCEVVWGVDGPVPATQFREFLRDATAVVFGTWEYGREAIAEAGPNLRHIFEVAGGHTHAELDYKACFARGITVGGSAPAFGPAVAEMALALTLAATRLVAEGDAAFRMGRERWLHHGTVGATTLYGRTVGFVGAGGLSRSLQPLLEPFGVHFLGFDPWLTEEDLTRRRITPTDLPTLFRRSDIIYVLAVPTPANFRLISRGLMEMLDPDNVLVIVSRAHLVDFEAMTDLVMDGRFKVALDVFPAEPFDRSHRLRGAPGAVLSAHRAGAIPEALLEIGRMVTGDLEALLAGRSPTRMQYATPDLIARLRN
ncbi:MAG: NAD(P)-dependent oxidoreductase [Acidimicrobiia bacterium]|nr:NAD(P)-dependent oxidoreductase [Acidimicrobiia bacterium]